MKYLRDVRENDRIMEHYLCKQKQILKSKSGNTYYSLKLQDKTAMIDAKVWDIHNDIGNFDENDVIKIDGTALIFNGEPQIKINRLRKSLENEYVLSELIPHTEKDINELYGKLLGFIDAIKQPQLRQMLENIVMEHPVISREIQTHSAAKQMHHNYMGGLLEHTIAVLEICDFLGKRYKGVDHDVLIAAAILHDIAKIFELSPMPINDYTDDGQMLGHIYMGAELVAKESAKISGFPHTLKSLLQHAILAHHGEYEFGSPKLPMTIEALILHAADNLDAKAKVYEDMIANNKSGSPWAGYHKLLGRYLRGSGYDNS
ncbi:MAG: HD domain-containing protein [Defluviitaleaceae bacterium]|nr:HD domain-containing protein [Defluviitaleaceae bacterium]